MTSRGLLRSRARPRGRPERRCKGAGSVTGSGAGAGPCGDVARRPGAPGPVTRAFGSVLVGEGREPGPKGDVTEWSNREPACGVSE